MSIDLSHPDFLDLRTRIREDPSSFVVVIGSGLSRKAGLPGWSELRDNLVNYAISRITDFSPEEQVGVQSRLWRIKDNSDLWEAFSELKEILPLMGYEETIRNNLTVQNEDNIPDTYDLIWRLGVKGVFTFNIDTCAIHSYSRVNKKAVDHATSKDVARFPQFLTSPNKFVFHAHGILSDCSSWVFTTSERRKILGSSSYIDFVRGLCQSKHLLILGFNPDDFAFKYLIQSVNNGQDSRWSKHYVLLSNPRLPYIKSLSEEGYAVIPYNPIDLDDHSEVKEALLALLSYIPKDDIPASVYTGEKTDPLSLPDDSELLHYPVDKVRELLNGAVAAIIPPKSQPSESDVDQLEAFYTKHLRAMHMAWLLEPNPECNIIHGYKVVNVKGRGAFGRVYEAEHIETGRRVAIKVLLPEVRHNKEYLVCFRRGVRSMRILTERDVARMVKIIDAFEVPASIVMDYVDGPTLTEAFGLGYLSDIKTVLEVIVQIGDVVQRAHNLDEVVLHRDLKPDNVILKDAWSKGDDIDVVVVDFDLSWHKGAMELSVIYGARTIGYAAPEQTGGVRSKNISTRSTAVDAFGYGMLGFFVFVGNDPRPNEQNFEGYEEKIKKAIRIRFNCKWRSIPAYLASVISQCTADEQSKRMPFSSAVSCFKNALMMIGSDVIRATDPLVLEELASIISPDSIPERFDFGRLLKIKDIDPSKQIEIKLDGKGEDVFVDIKIQKLRNAGDNRNVVRYLEDAKNKALAKIRKGPFRDVKGIIGRSELVLSCKWFLGKNVTFNDIKQAANVIQEAKSMMDLG